MENWWSWSGSNRRPPECKSGALPAELQPPKFWGSGLGGWGLGKRSIPFPSPEPPIPSPRFLIEADWMHGLSRQAGKPLRFIRRTPSQRCRDGLSGFPEGTPEVMEWNGCLLLSRSRDFRRLHPRSLRKEVIQPQVLLRLPCYDFTPIMSHTLGRCLPCGSACGLLVQPTFVM